MNDVTIDTAAAELEPEFADETPKEVKEVKLTYVPKKDFTARVNQTEYVFRKDVPQLVTRGIANMLLEDPDRGYVKE